jgi:formylglycine-generating enzyme required for sulfatase activity
MADFSKVNRHGIAVWAGLTLLLGVSACNNNPKNSPAPRAILQDGPEAGFRPSHPYETAVNPRDGLTYVWIPPGSFMMGCSAGDSRCDPAEKPAHQVTLTKGFWIGQTEVTQAAYKKRRDDVDPGQPKGDNLPIVWISWNSASAYCNGIGDMRLPTEAEWEYAARAGTSTPTYGVLDDIAWHAGNSGDHLHEVGKKKPNAWGLFDMLGNAREYTADWRTAGITPDSSDYPTEPQTDPGGPATGTNRVSRGGDFGDSPGIRVSERQWGSPSFGGAKLGFRCAGNYLFLK